MPNRSLGGADLRHDTAKRQSVVEEAYAVYKIGTVKESASDAEREAGRQKRLEAGQRFRRERAYPEHKNPEARAPYFIGVWDTVRSLGIPIGGRDWEIEIWPHRFHDHDLNEFVAYAYHALSIDDEREAFHPTIWNEPTKAELTAQRTGQPPKQKFEQVWFAGVHCDVGGGYKESGLSDVTLEWMIDRATAAEHPLLLVPEAKRDLNPLADIQIYNSRDTLWRKAVYRPRARTICKGIQQPARAQIEPAPGTYADLDKSWVSVMGTLHREVRSCPPEAPPRLSLGDRAAWLRCAPAARSLAVRALNARRTRSRAPALPRHSVEQHAPE